MAELRLSRRAQADLDVLPADIAERLLDALGRLESDPAGTALDIKALVGRRPWRRLRVGDYRVIFRVAGRGSVVLVGRVVDQRDLDRAIRSLP